MDLYFLQILIKRKFMNLNSSIKKFWWFALPILFLSFSVNIAIAGAFEDGAQAAARNDFASAYKLWLPLAENGEKKAQHNLGVMYNNGLGVAKDYKAAMKWYQLAAAQGYPDSQNNIAVLYDKGLGVTANTAEAFDWYQLSASQGFAEAQHNLGVMYFEGKGISIDNDKAYKWFKAASDQGHLGA
ncbi:MAG: hypothetical protein CTY16_15655, partial [Methylobacter sp.]